MPRMMITEHVWSRLAFALKKLKIHFSNKLRLFIEAVLWKLRTGVPWRDLPEEFGPYSTVFNKFNRWSQKGFWQEIFYCLRDDVDNEWNFIDASFVRVHQHASGARGNKEEATGKSAGGNTTKIHMLCDSHGNAIDFILTGGQVHDSKKARELIDMSEGESLIADKAYHSKEIRVQAEKKEMRVVIPVKSNSKDKSNPSFDSYLYKLRHIVENLFARLKRFRSIATRYDKTKINFASTLYLACAYEWAKF